MKKAVITILQVKPNGSRLEIILDAVVTTQIGSDEELGGAILEVERFGNSSGKARIHISVE